MSMSQYQTSEFTYSSIISWIRNHENVRNSVEYCSASTES